ncbi:unnamed protein product [Oppiella nova]|uniref:Uncharacterized protein n=1 Tax=Oppiella nova TaxID=334625 RepID=A0A7R9MFQ8_9ACAR|nr:unnamed protein product [Oppiella nova]CAG2176234.1 unnamed protein product [Oppiella nova]
MAKIVSGQIALTLWQLGKTGTQLPTQVLLQTCCDTDYTHTNNAHNITNNDNPTEYGTQHKEPWFINHVKLNYPQVNANTNNH